MEFVKLDDISVENSYLRLETDVSDLEKSIQALGLLSPLVIDSENLLLAGGRRYSALKNLGHEKVWVKRAKGDALEKELVSIDENLVRKDLEKVELEANLRRAKELYTELLNKEKGKALEVAKEIERMAKNGDENCLVYQTKNSAFPGFLEIGKMCFKSELDFEKRKYLILYSYYDPKKETFLID